MLLLRPEQQSQVELKVCRKPRLIVGREEEPEVALELARLDSLAELGPKARWG